MALGNKDDEYDYLFKGEKILFNVVCSIRLNSKLTHVIIITLPTGTLIALTQVFGITIGNGIHFKKHNLCDFNMLLILCYVALTISKFLQFL